MRPGAPLVLLSVVAALLAGCGAPAASGPHPRPLPVAADPGQCDYPRGYDAAPVADDPGADAALLATAGGPKRNLVVTPDPQASAAACRILAAGGTAADALVAAQYVLGLTEPQYSGPGGGGLALYYDGPSGTFEAYDGTVHAPAGDRGAAPRSALSSVGVPQTDRLMATLGGRFGTMPLAQLVAPARRLAASGFTVSARLSSAMAARSELFDPAALPRAGAVLTNPEYADYLDRLTAGSPLTGLAERLGRLGGLDEQPQVQALVQDWQDEHGTPVAAGEPLCIPYQDYRVCGSPSTATGFMIVAQTLGILDTLDLARLNPRVNAGPGRPVARATAVHLITEAQRLAFTDGNTWMDDPQADPDLARDYLDRIVTDRPALAAQAGRIRQRHTLDDPQPSRLDRRAARYADSTDQGTSQITVRDSAGSIATLTTTLQRSFGSGVKVDGFYLNNSLDNFTAAAGPDCINARAPGMRPRTMMSPVMVFDGADGPPLLALGSPGGRKIPSYVVKALVAMIDWGYSPLQAVQMPGFGATNRRAVYLEQVDDGGSRDDLRSIAALLKSWGHTGLDVGAYDSGLSVVRVDGGRAEAAADYRRHGLARGVDAS